MVFEIMFDDLKEDVQKELLKFYGVDKPGEMNFDVIPLTELVVGDKDESN